MTQLTLHLDDNLVLRAKAYAARKGKSLADLVAGYFTKLPIEAPKLEADRPQTVMVQESSAISISDSLPERQYRLASQYSGEYVVLVGERVIHHSISRKEAGKAYKQAFVDHPSCSPVMVDPNRPRRRRPIVRGRALNRQRRL